MNPLMAKKDNRFPAAENDLEQHKTAAASTPIETLHCSGTHAEAVYIPTAISKQNKNKKTYNKTTVKEKKMRRGRESEVQISIT